MIDSYRRDRDKCLYCQSPAVTREHPLPSALGGRLFARMLCDEHRHQISLETDESAIENFKPLVNFLAVRRQDGKTGIAFKAKTDGGEIIRVTEDGRVPSRELVVEQRDSTSRISRASGSLAKLDKLLAQKAFSESGQNLILAYITTSPNVNFEVDADSDIAGFILKLAFHFLAGYVSDPPLELASTILPFILGFKQPAGFYVSTPINNNLLFPESWPPRHELTVYPAASTSIVTVMLFNAYCYSVRLPIKLGGLPLRYTQPLLGRPDPRLNEIKDSIEVQWNYKIGQDDISKWGMEIHSRLGRIQQFAQRRVLRDQCRSAARSASIDALRTRRGADFFDYYRGQLQLQAFDAALVDRLVSIGRQLRAQWRPVWDF